MASENGSKVTTNSLLCETCVGMFTVEPLPDRNLSGMEVMRMPENPHHPSLQSLLDAAEKGCYICSYVVRQFERHGGKLHDVDNKTDIPAESMPATTYIIRPVLGSQVDEFTVWVSVTKHALQPGSTERCFHWVIRDGESA